MQPINLTGRTSTKKDESIQPVQLKIFRSYSCKDDLDDFFWRWTVKHSPKHLFLQLIRHKPRQQYSMQDRMIDLKRWNKTSEEKNLVKWIKAPIVFQVLVNKYSINTHIQFRRKRLSQYLNPLSANPTK